MVAKYAAATVGQRNIRRDARFVLEDAEDGAGDQVRRGHRQGTVDKGGGLGSELGATRATGGGRVALCLAGDPLPVPVVVEGVAVLRVRLVAELIVDVQAVGAEAVAILQVVLRLDQVGLGRL